MRRSGQPSPTIDKHAAVTVAVIAFCLIIYPVLTLIFVPHGFGAQVESRPETRIFWPAAATIAVLLAVQGRSRLSKLVWPPHIICLLFYVGFAGSSILWAFSPHSSFVRFLQQAMVVTSVVLPTMLSARTVDIIRGLFWCFAGSLALNLVYVFDGSVTIVTYGVLGAVDIGYQGYFEGKNYLGECAGIALLLGAHEALHTGFRRAAGLVVVVIAVLLLVLSQSKTALGLAFIAPMLATGTLIIRRIARISPAIILLSIPLCYIVVSNASNFNMNRISFMLYHDSTFTGRTVIWDFAQYEINRSPIVGWGYQSFWLVGPNAPSITEAPGWVKLMPNAHNGYYDTMLEMGYIGLILLLSFIITTLHAVGRVADRDPSRARVLLSLALFIIMYNFLESLWMRGFEFLWVIFLIVATEIARYWQPVLAGDAARRSRRRRLTISGIVPSVQTHQPQIRLS